MRGLLTGTLCLFEDRLLSPWYSVLQYGAQCTTGMSQSLCHTFTDSHGGSCGTWLVKNKKWLRHVWISAVIIVIIIIAIIIVAYPIGRAF
jgi:hypothetical protein